MKENFLFWGFITQLIAFVVGATMGVSRIKDSIRKDNQQHFDVLLARIDALGRTVISSEAQLVAKITEVEIWARDTFVRRDSFFAVTKDLKEDFAARLTKFEGQMTELVRTLRRDNADRNQ